jgi:CRP/FNR family transcriptional regulator, cyclic AMP receptor protein
MAKQRRAFSPKTFLTSVGAGRTMMLVTKGQTIYSLDDAADALFVIQKGQVKLSVKSQRGREAILDICNDGDFVGKDSIAGESSRTASAVAMTDCSVLRIEKGIMLLALKRQLKLANMFWKYVLARNIRYQQDLFGQHCISSEKRLARTLLSLAHFSEKSSGAVSIPNIHHQTLADMVGTTRSRAAFFMTKFRKSGLIDYTRPGEPLLIYRSLLAFCQS